MANIGDHRGYTVQRALLYALGFIMASISVGVVLGIGTVSKIMVHKPPKAPEAPMPARSVETTKPKILVFLSNTGTEVTDLAAPVEVFGRSGRYEVITAAPERKLSPTTGAVSILPQFTLKDAPEAEILVVPAVVQTQDEPLIRSLQARAEKARMILCMGEGARICAIAGLLKNQKATSHFVALGELEKSVTDTRWINGPSAVESGRIITSAGIMASIDASLLALERVAGKEIAGNVSNAIGYAPQDHEIERVFRPADGIELVLQAAFNWKKQHVAIWLSPGASELGLASALDTFPRTFSTHAFTLSAEPAYIRTLHGLDLVATENLKEGLPADFLLVPPGSSLPKDAASAEALKSWQTGFMVRTKDLSSTPPGRGFEAILRWILEDPRFQETASSVPVVAKFISSPFTPGELHVHRHFWLYLRPILVGLLGVLVMRIFERRFLPGLSKKPSAG